MIPDDKLNETVTVKRPPTEAEATLDPTGDVTNDLVTVGTLKVRITRYRRSTQDVLNIEGKGIVSTHIIFAKLSGSTNSSAIIIKSGWYIFDSDNKKYAVLFADNTPGGVNSHHQQVHVNLLDQ